MSLQIICPECNTPNSLSSKFCNDCGARLPKSTSVLCPKCQSPNPRNNFYCDHCGSRLQSGQPPATPEPEKPEDSDLPTSAKMFSLPTRQPGDTGELDPNSIPDWLTTQSEKETNDSGKLPKLSDLTPQERATDADLPRWLIDTDSQELLIESPGDITTEHFFHLIQNINEEERKKLSGLLNDPAVTGDEGANLPDWLKGLSTPAAPTGKNPKPAPLPEPEDDDTLDWLSDFDAPQTNSLAEPVNSLPHPEQSFDDDDDLPDWLSELKPPQTELLALPNQPEESAAGFSEEDIPDWMETDAAKSAADPADLSDWLLTDAEMDQAAAETIKPAAAEAAAARSLTDWLSDFDAEEADEDIFPAAEASPIEAESSAKETLTDWLDDLSDDTTDAAEEDASTSTGLTKFLIAAEADETETDSAPATGTLPDWLLADQEEAAPKIEAAAPEEPAGFDFEDWLEDKAEDPSVTVGDTGPLPDWLDDLAPDKVNAAPKIDSSELESTLDDLFGKEAIIHTGDLDWLDEPILPDKEVVPAAVEDVAQTSEFFEEDDEAPPDTADDNLDWLAEMVAFEAIKAGQEAVAEAEEETAVPEFFPGADIDWTEEDDIVEQTLQEAKSDEFNIDDFLDIDAQVSGDWADIDGILSGAASDDQLPDWLEQLEETGLVTALSPEEAEEEITADNIPDWIANMRPDDTGQLASVLPSAFLVDSDASDLLSDTEELTDAELPDWLDSSLMGDRKTAVSDSRKDVLWLDDGSLSEDSSELEAILAELPPAQAPEDMLLKAEIPDWLEELKPRELKGEAVHLAEPRFESSGPLAGMPNTIAVEPIIAMPRAASALGAYTVTTEQAQQARLLRQMMQEGIQPPPAAKPILSATRAAWLRILVALLLLTAVFLGLYGPAGLQSTPPAAVPAPAAALNSAVAQAAGKPVLVAFEYTPAYGGELNHEVNILLDQLAAAGRPLITVSQYTAGTAVAAAQTAAYDVIALPLVPGEAMGLRQLGSCLGQNGIVCTSLHGHTLTPETAQLLNEVSLVILFTGERSSLVNWVEQVGGASDVPLAVGATQALAPVVSPYYASGQVTGYLDGLPAAIAYKNAYQPAAETAAADAQYGAQSLVLLVTAVILLIGGLAFGLFRKKS
ncbi:MAG: zinc ribbon domain-containing protein [Chloroflexota bacterium]